MSNMNKNVLNRAKKIKLVITDVDGVLTDGGMYYTSKGDIMKKFYVRDGMGVTLLRKNNIPTIIVTKEQSPMVKQWAKKMKVKKLYDGIVQKDLILDEICKKFKITFNEAAYIGDDLNDIKLLKMVGLSAVPNDGINEAKNICNYVCTSNSGRGAFREFVELILLGKGIRIKDLLS